MAIPVGPRKRVPHAIQVAAQHGAFLPPKSAHPPRLAKRLGRSLVVCRECGRGLQCATVMISSAVLLREGQGGDYVTDMSHRVVCTLHSNAISYDEMW